MMVLHGMTSRVGMTVAALLALTSSALAQLVAIPPQNVPGSRMPSRPLPAILTMPGGKGPFPAIILLHGCSGHFSTLQGWARRLSDWGYASLIPDSYGPRRVDTVCLGPVEQRAVTPQDRAGDVVSAALWLRTRPEIDGAHIGVIGFSNGGWTAMWVTQRRYEQLYPGLIRAAVSYYGNCAHPEEHGSVPLLVLVGEDDDWAYPARHCREFGARLAPEQNFEIHTYPNVVHAFDVKTTSWRSSGGEGHAEQYDAAATSDSFIRTRAFLDHYLIPSRNQIGTPPVRRATHGNRTVTMKLGNFTTLLSPQPQDFLNRTIGKTKKHGVCLGAVLVPAPARHHKNIAWLPV
jgi:dienelactone hydrolase